MLEKKINLIKTSDLKKLDNYDLAVIASPATLHHDDAMILMHLSNLLILEKPLTHNLDSSLDLNEVVKKSGNTVKVAYHLRFSETVNKLRELISSLSLGRMKVANLNYSQNIKIWRPQIDFMQSVSTRQELGGGVLLELSHEIDAVHFLIGDFVSIKTSLFEFDDTISDGKVDTKVSFAGTTIQGVSVSIYLDMVTFPATRIWNFTFDRGEIQADLLTGEIFVSVDRKKFEKYHQSGHHERDRAGAMMLATLLDNSKENENQLCSIPEAVSVMRVIESVKNSARLKEEVLVSSIQISR